MPSARTSRRVSKLPTYEAILDLPPLSFEDHSALKDNIAVNGVLVPILVDTDGPKRRIIDGVHRKQIADDLGYDCPEHVCPNLDEAELRTLARALNLARRQLTQEQKRHLIADQLRETAERSNRWVGKQLGVHHATVASVRADLHSTGQVDQLDRTLGSDGKFRPAFRQLAHTHRSPAERQSRLGATSLIHGDCRSEMKRLPTSSVDAIITDPIYPEVNRGYGRIGEAEWHDLMHDVVRESRRLLKPTGSAVFILQPNAEKVGQMRLWLWEFVAWAGREWNLVQDAWWWAVDAMPVVHSQRKVGLMRPSVKMCVWLGPADCYRNQEAVLWTPSDVNSSRRRSESARRVNPSGRSYSQRSICGAADDRGGTTPFNLLPIPVGGDPGGREGHPAGTPYELAHWWTRYILPTDGVLLDPFCGSGTMLTAGLDQGASKVIGIDREEKYLATARARIEGG